MEEIYTLSPRDPNYNPPGPYTCRFCGKEKIPHWKALMLHLRWCPNRLHDRIYEMPVQGGLFRFRVRMNPLHRIARSLHRVREDGRSDPKIFTGALVYLQYSGQIKEFAVDFIPEASG